MASVSAEQTVSLPEAADLLGVATEDVFDLVFSGQLTSVEMPSGRRVVPRSAIERWKASHEAPA
jgi:hypothetical protein